MPAADIARSRSGSLRTGFGSKLTFFVSHSRSLPREWRFQSTLARFLFRISQALVTDDWNGFASGDFPVCDGGPLEAVIEYRRGGPNRMTSRLGKFQNSFWQSVPNGVEASVKKFQRLYV
jgi:hypothetical protein